MSDVSSDEYLEPSSPSQATHHHTAPHNEANYLFGDMRCDMIYDLASRVQDYCRQHSLPIFNKFGTTTIIADTFITQ